MRRLVPLLFIFFALAETADAAWVWPVSGDVITPYRNGTDPYATGQHRGIDIAAPVGTPVVAAAGGDVRFAGTAGSSGLTISIRTGDGYDTSYLHLSSLDVRAGAHVSGGDRIGAVGTTGVRSATAPHLHFGVRDAGTRHDYHDPLAFLPPPPPPARAPDPPPPAPAPAPQPAPPAPAPVTGRRTVPRPHAAPHRRPLAPPRRLPHATPHHRPHAVPHSVPHAVPHRVPHAVPHAVPHQLPLAAPRARPDQAARSRIHVAPRSAAPPSGDPTQRGERAIGASRSPVRAEAGQPPAKQTTQASAGGGFDLGWAAACAGLLLAAGLLGMTGGTRRRPPRLPAWAFFLAKWQGKTPNPAQRPRG